MKSKTHANIILLLAALFPVLLRICFPSTYYHNDVITFVEWADYTTHFRDLYHSYCHCNYPVVGLLLTTGILKILSLNVFYFLLFLTLFDSANILITNAILKRLEVRHHVLWACLIGLMPSTWIGGSFWGQIDHIGLFFLLLIIWWVLYFNQSASPRREDRQHKHSTDYLIFTLIASLVFSFALLTKQLLVFSLFPLSLLILISICLRVQFHMVSVIKAILGGLIAIGCVVVSFDFWLAYSDEYISHFEKVIVTGSNHMDKISGNGFNVWMLLFRDMWSSSNVPFFAGLTPKGVGSVLFIIHLVVLSCCLVIRCGMSIQTALTNEMVVHFLFYLALMNLGFNLFLSGTHERYLYYFYPFLLIALLGRSKGDLSDMKKIQLVMVIVGAVLYGLFVLSIMLYLKYSGSHIVMLVFHSILYIIFMRDFVKGCDLTQFKSNVSHYRDRLIKVR